MSFFDSLTICLVKSVVLTVLCRDNLKCGSLNSYIARSTILLRQIFYATSSNWCHDRVFMLRQHLCFGSCCNTVLVLSEFLSRPTKFVAIEFCRHLT